MQPAEAPARSLAAAPQGWDVLPLPALELSSDAQALQANAAMAALAGMPAAALLGTGWFAVLSPDRRAALFNALAAQRDFSLEIRLLRHDRVKAWVELNARWLPQSGSFLCLLHDHTAVQQAVQDAQAVSSRFGLLADNVPVLIAYYEAAGFTCLYANRQYAATFGLQPEAVLGRTFAQIIGEAAAAEIQPQVDLMMSTRRTVSYMRRLTDPRGKPRWIEVSLVPHLGSDGNVFGAFVLIADITRHREAEAAVRESEERMAKFMEASVEGISFHQDGLITDANRPMLALVGATSPDQVLGRHVFEFIAPHQLARVQQVMEQGAELSYETEIVDLAGRSIPVEFIVRTLVRGEQKLRMAVVRDIRDRLAAQARIRQLALNDTLTGLRNRGAFVERLEAELAHPPAAGRIALLFIDLDHFKRINDSLGHLAGDALLRAIGARIADALPANGAAGRFGGDEFVVLLPGVADRHEVLLLAERLRAAVQAPVPFDGRSLCVTPTVGVALFPDDGRDADTLLRHADAALYAGKAAGRAAISFFEPALGAALDAGLQLEARLAEALQRGEFELLLQPRLDAVDGRLVAVEALLRWRHPQQGLLAPVQFAAALAQPRLLQPVAEWAVREALALQRGWAAAADVPVVLALGSLRLGGQALVATLAQLPAGGSPLQGRFVLALDERQCADEAALLPRLLTELQRLGVPLLLDGLGSGGFALTRLRELPLAGWSLDPALVDVLPQDAAAMAVAQALIGLARSLGRSVVASGITREPQRRWLADAGCAQLQGPALVRAMTPEELGRWLAER